jgi:2-octaprenyl-6-methoxyphenol hydroxylase
MTKPHDTDVLIVGGGLAGAALSLALARGGLSSILLDTVATETRADPGFDGRAYALAAASVNLLRGIGVWGTVAAHAQPMTAIEIFDGEIGRPGPVRLRFEGAELDTFPFAVLLEDRFLRPALLEAVAAEPLVEQRAPFRAVAHEAGATGATVTGADGTVLRGAVAVAADGRRSPLAAAAGLRWSGRRYGQTGLVCAIDLAVDHGGLARQVFYPGGPFAVLPLPERRAQIVWSERTALAERIAGLDDAGYLEEIRRRLGGLAEATGLAGRRWAYPLELALAYAFAAPRLALLGDAAHAMHPIAGQGFNVGLRDVATLAEVLAEARRRGEDVGTAAVLDRYQRWRRFDSTALGGVTDGLNRLFSTDAGPVRALRDAGLRFVNAAPGIKRRIMTAAAGLDGDLPRLLRGEAP